MFIKALAELSGEQIQARSREPITICPWMKGWDVHAGVAEHTLRSQSGFLETTKTLLISLLRTRIKDVLLKGIPWQGHCSSPAARLPECNILQDR